MAVCGFDSVSKVTADKPVSCTDELKTSILGINEIGTNSNATYYTIHYVWNKLYKRQHIDANRFVEEIRFAEDEEYNTRILCGIKDLKVSVIEFPLYYYYQRSNSIVHTENYAEIIYAGKNSLKSIESDRFSMAAKKVLLFRSFKNALTARYLSRFDSDSKYKVMSRQMIKNCLRKMKGLDNISFKEKTKYKILSYFPIVYRMYRIITDPTMLDWEKNQRKEKQKR